MQRRFALTLACLSVTLPSACPHAIGLRLKDDPDLIVTARSSYWATAP
jgi:hypothetical protein